MNTTNRIGRLALVVAAVLLALAPYPPTGAGAQTAPGESPLPPEGIMEFDEVPVVGWTRVDIHVEQATTVTMLKAVTQVDGPGYRAVMGWRHLHTDDADNEDVEWLGAGWLSWGRGDGQHIRVDFGPVQEDERTESNREPTDGLNRANFGHAFLFPPGRHTMYEIYGVSEETETQDPVLEVRWEVEDPVADPYVDLEVSHSTRAWFEDDRHFDVTVQVRDDARRVNTIVEGRRTIEVENSASGLFWIRPWGQNSAAGTMSVDGPRSCTLFVATNNNQGVMPSVLNGAPAGEYTFHVDMVSASHLSPISSSASPYAATPVLFLADLPIPEGDPAIQPGDEPVLKTVNKTTCDPEQLLP